MTISAQSLSASQRNKFNALRRTASPGKLKAMDKKLAKIVQTAIRGAGAAEAANIKKRIATALERAFRLSSS
jgi:hypothetical protein